jgi:hypothetical protein
MSQPFFARACAVGIVLIIATHVGCSRQPLPADQVATVDSTDQPAVVVDQQVPRQDEASPDPQPVDSAAPPMTDPRTAGPEPTQSPGSKAPPGSLQESLDNQPPPQSGDETLAELGYKSPAERLQEKLAPPPNATRISKMSPLWIDMQSKRVFVDGYVAQREAFLEMFACDSETKEHESVLGVAAKSSEVHAALLAIGGQVGKTVRFDPEYVAATGQRIRIWLMWRDEEGNFKTADAREWVRNAESKKQLDRHWVFAGSYIWKDPSDGKEYYQADSGEMICVSNFSTALMDLPIASSDSNSALQFEAFTERIPPMGTFVRLMLVPLPPENESEKTTEEAEPNDDDQPKAESADQRPDESLMPLKELKAS